MSSYKTHKMPDQALRRVERETGRRFPHATSKMDPSIVIISDSTVDQIISELLLIAEHRNERWF